MGTLNSRCRIIIGTQKGTISLTTTHIFARAVELKPDIIPVMNHEGFRIAGMPPPLWMGPASAARGRPSGKHRCVGLGFMV